MARIPGAAPMPAVWLAARLMQLPLDAAVRRALAQHPGLLARLGWEEERRVLVQPDGLPLAFLVRCSVRRARIEAVSANAAPDVHARIRGPIAALFDLTVGDDDGDAQFFSRVLRIEGDTATVVALRNAIDDAELEPLADFLSLPEPLVPVVRGGIARLARLARSASEDFAALHRLLMRLAPMREGGAR